MELRRCAARPGEVHGTILPVLKVEHAAHDVVSSADARLLAHLNEPERSDGGGCCPREHFHVAWREEKDPTGFEGVVGTELGVRIFLPTAVPYHPLQIL